jgi:hypothetical protein
MEVDLRFEDLIKDRREERGARAEGPLRQLPIVDLWFKDRVVIFPQP